MRRDLIEAFEDTMKVSKRFFGKVDSRKYNDKLDIVWSDNTVKNIIDNKGRHVAALNFADGYELGGLVWKGVKTQEEYLCRSSNLYLALSAINYPIDGSLVYSKDIVFFRDDKLEWLDKPVRCDIISCPAPISTIVDAERRMRMIVESAKVNGAVVLILSKWGCGAFGNDWDEYEKLWMKVLDDCN